MDLNPSQASAIRHKEGPMLVLAGPGSGQNACDHRAYPLSDRRMSYFPFQYFSNHVYKSSGNRDERTLSEANGQSLSSHIWNVSCRFFYDTQTCVSLYGGKYHERRAEVPVDP